MLEQNKVTNIVTLEAKELPLLIQSLKFYKGFLEITATTCLARNPDCMPLGELRVFTAKKRNNYLSDTATLYYKINTIEYFPKDTESSEYKAFYNQIFKIAIDLKKDEFIYFFSEGYCLIELNVKWLFQKIKKKYY